MKNSSFKMSVVFSLIFVADTKITFVYNFEAPLNVAHVQSTIRTGIQGKLLLKYFLSHNFSCIDLKKMVYIFIILTYIHQRAILPDFSWDSK